MLQKIISFLIPAIVLVVIPEIISDGRTCPIVKTFECANGSYIDAKFECDGFKNCADGSDEICEDCIAKLGGGMCCDTSKYIPPYWVCDGYLHCGDEKDETTCGCECFCPSSNVCLDPEFICDTRDDCPDKSDEDYTYCNSTIRSDIEGVLAPRKKTIVRSRQVLAE